MVNKKMAESSLTNWLEKNKIDEKEAKEILRAVRNQKSRDYSTHSHSFSGKHIKIGVIGDSHFGNKWADYSFFKSCIEHMKKEKVEAIYHVGDITDGPWQRHGNVLEQYALGFEQQVDDVVEHLPDLGKKKMFLINGNHDQWYVRDGSGNPAKHIASLRDDVEYLGDMEAVIKFGNIQMMMSHPEDGTSYAYSYKAQKFIESMVKMEETIPHLILQGHYHKLFYMNGSGTNYWCTGTTCRQTPWMRGKKIGADLGAWILDIHRDSKGKLARIDQSLLSHTGDKHTQVVK